MRKETGGVFSVSNENHGGHHRPIITRVSDKHTHPCPPKVSPDPLDPPSIHPRASTLQIDGNIRNAAP